MSYKKLFFIIITLLFLQNFNLKLFAQKKIQYSAEWSFHDEDILPGITKLAGNVKFSQNKVVGYCDSAYLHENENLIEAFGKNVIIHINDSVTLYGKYLIYNGDTKISSISRNVILKDNTSKLYTDSLIYDLNTNEGYYVTGGRMINKKNTLTSKIGFYNTNSNLVRLYNKVFFINDSYSMNCDSIYYNTNTETVYFISPTDLISKEDSNKTMHANGGWYDSKTEIAFLKHDVQIHGERHICADSMYYEKATKFSQGWSNVSIRDTIRNFILKCNYIEYYDTAGISMATDSALLIMIDNRDSLYCHADTFHIYIDSTQNVEQLQAFYHVKFFRKDLQGASDSLSYTISDSTMVMYYNPVVWSEGYQLTADTIFFYIIDSSYVKMHLSNSAFVVASQYGGSEFDQIKGIDIYGHIIDKILRRVDVVNNAECIYFIQEEDSSLIGINSSICDEMKIVFDEDGINTITNYYKPDGTISPNSRITQKDKILKDFRWLDFYRPKEKIDIFSYPVPRFKTSN